MGRTPRIAVLQPSITLDRLERIVRQRHWQNLRAVQAGRVVCIPDAWLDTPAPTLLDGLEALAAALHPALFSRKERVRTLDTIASAEIAI